jgi:hypothetical protein
MTNEAKINFLLIKLNIFYKTSLKPLIINEKKYLNYQNQLNLILILFLKNQNKT